jgi:RND family efflux transporter MFP subunit
MRRIMQMGAAAVVAVLAWSCGGRGEAATPDEAGATPRVVLGERDIATVRRVTLREGVPVSGPLEPKVNVVVGAPLAEQVAEMFVEAGVPVRAGQPLARFRDEVLRAAAASARADVTRAELAVRVAVADSARAATLFREGAIAQRDLDNALVAVEGARAQLALARAQAASANDRLATATLRAPTGGVVSERHVQAGDRVDFGKPVVNIVDTRVLRLEASVPAQALGHLRVGRAVVLVATSGDTVSGRVARINPIADPATRQVRLYVDVPNPAGRLVGGLYVSGHVLVREVVAAAVPRQAVRREASGRPVVYVVRQDTVRRVEVELGTEDAEQGLIEVVAGLVEGDTVVVGPADTLGDGAPVSVAAAAR